MWQPYSPCAPLVLPHHDDRDDDDDHDDDGDGHADRDRHYRPRVGQPVSLIVVIGLEDSVLLLRLGVQSISNILTTLCHCPWLNNTVKLSGKLHWKRDTRH